MNDPDSLYIIIHSFFQPFLSNEIMPLKEVYYIYSSAAITSFSVLLCAGVSALWGCVGALAALGKRR